MVAEVPEQVSAVVVKRVIDLRTSFGFGKLEGFLVPHWSVDLEYSKVSGLVLFPD